MKAQSDSSRGTSAPLPWIWHAVLAAGPALGVLAALLDPSLAESALAHAQLEIVRGALGAAAAALLGVWLLRRTITADVRGTLARWRAARRDPRPSALVPGVGPSGFAIVLWIALAAWGLSVAGGLAVGARWLELVTYENGPLETATVVAYGAAAILALSAFRRERRADGAGGRSLRPALLLALAASCFLIAGEETDWGQTYLGYETPAAFQDANIQHDFSLHNLAPPGAVPATRWANWLLRLLALMGGGVLPLLLWRAPWLRRLSFALDAPLPPWWSQVVLLLAVFIPDLPGVYERNNVGSELREFSISVAVLVWLLATRLASGESVGGR